MASIRGTYDVLMIAFPLPRAQVIELLPASVRQAKEEESLFSVPESVLKAVIGADDIAAYQHIVVLQMGYQISTGPGPTWLPKFSFSECKLEIPFVRHPSDTSGKSSVPLTYKQTILFSNPVIRMGSSASGIDSKTAAFHPPATPHGIAADSERIAYKAQGFLDASAVRLIDDEQRQQASSSWQVYSDFAQGWWFARGTGDKVQKFDFDFDNAVIAPTPYDVQLDIDLAAFRPDDATDATNSVLGQHTARAIGWRSSARMVSSASQLQQILT